MPGPASIRSHRSRFSQQGPPSPTLTATTSVSFLEARGPAVVVTRADLKQSLSAFEQLLGAAKGYRSALLSLATAASAFGSALEECARQKGASSSTYEGSGPNPGEQLMAASGLHHLLGNHHQILGDSLYRQFEVPLMDEFDTHKQRVAERQAQYEKATQEKAKLIRDTESKNVKLGKKKLRDLSSFRRALAELQSHVNDLDNLKIEHYSEVYEYEQEMWELIASKVTPFCLPAALSLIAGLQTAKVIRSETDVFDKIATKGNTDPTLDAMQQAYPDPFNAYAQKEGEIFSILSPLAIGPATALTKTTNTTIANADLSTPTKPKLKPSGSSSPEADDPNYANSDAEPEESLTPTQSIPRKLSVIDEDAHSQVWGAEDRLSGWLDQNADRSEADQTDAS